MRKCLERAITRAMCSSPARITPMNGGCVGQVYKVILESGQTIVAKVGDDIPVAGLFAGIAFIQGLHPALALQVLGNGACGLSRTRVKVR